MERKIKRALISVFNKENLDKIVHELHKNEVLIYSTGGTEKFISNLGCPVEKVEDLTSYPSILGGRVKTLHPKIFGGILNRREDSNDQAEIRDYEIPNIDLVIVDLYPFEETVAAGGKHEDIIEKIDIGGISLIRAAAKNFNDVLIISSRDQYLDLLDVFSNQGMVTNLDQRKNYAAQAFNISSHYDTQIFNYFTLGSKGVFKESIQNSIPLRYGENPHQKGDFYGNMEEVFNQLHGKELSYNNLLDVDAAVNLINEFIDCPPTFAILKHNNACGLATRATISEAYKEALSADPVSAFGGILIANVQIDLETSKQINELFCEVVIAPDFDEEGLEILKGKKNRIILKKRKCELPTKQFRTVLNGVLVQEKDLITDQSIDFEVKTNTNPTDNQLADLEFANKIAKHTKSNTIVLAKEGKLLASGTGQTSRVDALKQAIQKANSFNFDLSNSVMASDAFFPFPDCVEIAFNAGVRSVIQPGGSLKDQLSIDFCNENAMSMVFTGNRHFKH